MNTELTETEFDRALLQLRIVLANALTVTDAIRALRPRGNHLSPNLYSQLGTLQHIVRRSRAVLRRYLPPETDSNQ